MLINIRVKIENGNINKIEKLTRYFIRRINFYKKIEDYEISIIKNDGITKTIKKALQK